MVLKIVKSVKSRWNMKNRIGYIILFLPLIFISPVYAKTTYVKCGNIQQLPYKILQLSNTGINILQI